MVLIVAVGVKDRSTLRIVRQSRASYKRGGGLTREELEERLAKTRGA